jgi:hypothetical protein
VLTAAALEFELVEVTVLTGAAAAADPEAGALESGILVAIAGAVGVDGDRAEVLVPAVGVVGWDWAPSVLPLLASGTAELYIAHALSGDGNSWKAGARVVAAAGDSGVAREDDGTPAVVCCVVLLVLAPAVDPVAVDPLVLAAAALAVSLVVLPEGVGL